MADFLTRDQLLLAAVEAVRGTEETLAPADDAIKVSNLVWNQGLETDPGDSEHIGSLDSGTPVLLGGGAGVTFGVRVKGAGTAGQPPEWGRLLQGCGMQQTLNAAVSDTAQAGGASSITLHAGASASDDAYKGRVIELTAGPGNGESNVIVTYNGSTKVATVARPWTTPPTSATDFTILADARYRLASADLETLTFNAFVSANESGVQAERRKVIGAMGNASLELGAATVPLWSFTFSGLLPSNPDNVARPVGVAFDPTEAPPFVAAEALYGGNRVRFQRLSLDLGNNIAVPDDPAQTYGKAPAAVTSRRVTGTMTPYRRLKSEFDFMADFVDQTPKAMVLRWGSTPGNRISMLLPAVHGTGPEETDINGFHAESIPFASIGPDDGLWICVH